MDSHLLQPEQSASKQRIRNIENRSAGQDKSCFWQWKRSKGSREMDNLQDVMREFFGRFTGIFNSVGISDIIDVAIVAYIVYHGVRLVKETRAMQLVKGIGGILVLYFMATQLKMLTLSFLIQYVWQAGLFTVVVLFQPEIRRALEQMGRTKLGISRLGGQLDSDDTASAEKTIDIVVDSCSYLSQRNTGALLVLERETRLGDVIKTGTLIDSRPSVELISNIFFINSPLHDGAMVIREQRLCAAGCYLPLSQNMDIGRELGTRHRAALGMSEVSDAMVVVVSEETGAISLAMDSRLRRNLTPADLKKLLHDQLLGANEPEKTSQRKNGFWRGKK